MTGVAYEPLALPATLADQPPLGRDEVDVMIARVLARIDRALPDFGEDAFPAPSSEQLVYTAIGNVEWTNGFWTGMLWLAFELTGEARYRRIAEAHVVSFADRALRRINTDHHDMGFLYSPSACAAWALTANEQGRTAGIAAADLLMERYSPVAHVIQAWGDLSDPEEAGRMIIDCNLNLPLLWWAAGETGDDRYRAASDAHVARAAELLVRPDASTFHTFYVDTQTGAPRFGRTHQGHSDESCWARGQAWGIYGFALGHRHTGDPALATLAGSLANYFLNRLPADGICHWDLIFTAGDKPRDSSAAAIAASGLLELAGWMDPAAPDRVVYESAAAGMLRTLDRAYLAPLRGANGVLAEAVYHMPNRLGVRESCIWGDYFYLEALVRARGTWRTYW